MLKVKRASQIHGKEEGVKILEDKFCLSEDNMNQSKLDHWISEIEKEEIEEWTVQDIEKWNGIRIDTWTNWRIKLNFWTQ